MGCSLLWDPTKPTRKSGRHITLLPTRIHASKHFALLLLPPTPSQQGSEGKRDGGGCGGGGEARRSSARGSESSARANEGESLCPSFRQILRPGRRGGRGGGRLGFQVRLRRRARGRRRRRRRRWVVGGERGGGAAGDIRLSRWRGRESPANLGKGGEGAAGVSRGRRRRAVRSLARPANLLWSTIVDVLSHLLLGETMPTRGGEGC